LRKIASISSGPGTNVSTITSILQDDGSIGSTFDSIALSKVDSQTLTAPILPKSGSGSNFQPDQWQILAPLLNCVQNDLEYQIFPIADPQFQAPNKIDVPKSEGEGLRYIVPKCVAREAAETEVWAVTGTTGPVKGTLIKNPYFIKMAGSKTFQENWAVRLERDTMPGDCGSWVVDATTGEIYGHIVAGDPTSSLAYIIPAYKVFDDIKRRHGIEPLLPTEKHEVKELPNEQKPKPTRRYENECSLTNLIHQSLPPGACWPEVFTKRRSFNRQVENQPYIEFLKSQLFNGEEDDIENEVEDEVEGHRDALGNQDEKLSDDKGIEACNRYSDVRRFMEGTGEDTDFQYRDQVEMVASFCEQANLRELKRKSGQKALDGKGVALLDDRIGGIMADKKGHCRPYLGPLTGQRLREELRKKVTQISCWYRASSELTQTAQRFRVESEQTTAANTFEDEESDAERRVV
jgi:hypothetical protein